LAFNAFNKKRALDPKFGTWFVKSCSNKLKLVYPSKLYIAKILADGTWSLKNLIEIPGVTWGGSIVGGLAVEILKIMLSAPLKMPV